MASAGGILESLVMTGVTAYEKIHQINHWQGITAGAIAIWLLRAVYNSKIHPDKHVRKAKAFVFFVTGSIALGFFIAEYWPVFEFIGSEIFEFIIWVFS